MVLQFPESSIVVYGTGFKILNVSFSSRPCNLSQRHHANSEITKQNNIFVMTCRFVYKYSFVSSLVLSFTSVVIIIVKANFFFQILHN